MARHQRKWPSLKINRELEWKKKKIINLEDKRVEKWSKGVPRKQAKRKPPSFDAQVDSTRLALSLSRFIIILCSIRRVRLARSDFFLSLSLFLYIRFGFCYCNKATAVWDSTFTSALKILNRVFRIYLSTTPMVLENPERINTDRSFYFNSFKLWWKCLVFLAMALASSDHYLGIDLD